MIGGIKKITSVASVVVLGLALVGCGGQRTTPTTQALSSGRPELTASIFSAKPYVVLNTNGNIVVFLDANDGNSFSIAYVAYTVMHDDLAREYLVVSFRDGSKDFALGRYRNGMIDTVSSDGQVKLASGLPPKMVAEMNNLFDEGKNLLNADATIADYLQIHHLNGWPSIWPPGLAPSA